ncbi:MAG: ABC transporter ATP-binding protein [Anaerolineales bacterium]|nr:ABC transporter ATP-binding protein [Anaerolineales bacterium]
MSDMSSLLTQSNISRQSENMPLASYLPSNVVISLENAGVCYRKPSERIRSFKEYIIRQLKRQVQHKQFWALRDVNLTIYCGEVFGLIGSNGAGKSTLLKLVARVLRPTTGRVVTVGKVAPLLDISAGFHNELTGRENVFLNGALLGFGHKEMEAKFERIVDFAEIWDFIDAPLRTYSSGMKARLAFSIATDVKPDILIVDEVLSVGDESFREKSAARIQQFRDQGATILIVSHSMTSISEMCNRSALLEHGLVVSIGETEDVIQAYRQIQRQRKEANQRKALDPRKNRSSSRAGRE